MRDFIAQRLVITAIHKARVRRGTLMRPSFEVMPISRKARVLRMHIRQCQEVSRLTSRLLVETLTFDAMVRLLRAAQVVLRWNMVALCPGFSLP